MELVTMTPAQKGALDALFDCSDFVQSLGDPNSCASKYPDWDDPFGWKQARTKPGWEEQSDNVGLSALYATYRAHRGLPKLPDGVFLPATILSLFVEDERVEARTDSTYLETRGPNNAWTVAPGPARGLLTIVKKGPQESKKVPVEKPRRKDKRKKRKNAKWKRIPLEVRPVRRDRRLTYAEALAQKTFDWR